MINFKDFDWNLLKIDKKSYKSIDIYYIAYITIKGISDYGSINSVKPLYFIVVEVDGFIEKTIGISIYFLLPQTKTKKY